MILCDLPYGVTDCHWDKCLDLTALFKQYDRIIKKNGVIALFGMGLFSVDLITAYRRYYRYTLIWEKPTPVGFLNSHSMPLRSHEDILIFYKRKPPYTPQKTLGVPYSKRGKTASNNVYGTTGFTEGIENKGDRLPTSIIRFAPDKNNQFKGDNLVHPTQKPTAILEWLIRSYTVEGAVVLDNCAGSGSTGLAAMNTGRNFILIEKDKEFFKKAWERITAQGNELTHPVLGS